MPWLLPPLPIAATKREARHRTTDEHRDIFSSITQSAAYKCIATGKSLAECPESPLGTSYIASAQLHHLRTSAGRHTRACTYPRLACTPTQWALGKEQL